jgi:6-phosphogluconolactonase
LRVIRAPDAASAAALAAQQIAAACREAVDARGHAVIAVSGGTTPWLMLEHLAGLELPWASIHLAQVDERIAPRGDARRNLTRLERTLVTDGPLPRAHLHAMPVEAASAATAAADYQRLLEQMAGRPATLDLVQLGLGVDGHTASLVPGDPVLEVADRDVAIGAPYQGLPRMTLTYPALDRARRRLWLVTGAEKAARLAELLAGAPGDAPAVRVSRADAIVVADAAALATGAARPEIVARPPH